MHMVSRIKGLLLYKDSRVTTAGGTAATANTVLADSGCRGRQAERVGSDHREHRPEGESNNRQVSLCGVQLSAFQFQQVHTGPRHFPDVPQCWGPGWRRGI